MKQYRWGIIGTGSMANQMAIAINTIKNSRIEAVLSRADEKATQFANKFHIPNAFSNRDLFAKSGLMDVVHIATPHISHFEDTILCLSHGMHVLCEKPMAVNARDVAQMIQKAQEKKLFLMEAMWSAFFPAYHRARSLITNGEIGAVKHVDAKFGFRGDWMPEGRHLNPSLAGGALLDVGIYVLYFATLMMNDFPVAVSSSAHIGKTGVDELSAYLLHYSNGAMATLTSSVQLDTEHTGYIYGTQGHIIIPKFWQPDRCILVKNGQQKIFSYKRFGNGYTYEARHVMQCLDEKQSESDVLPLSQSLKLAEMMDGFRKDWGLKYPFE